MLLAMLCICQYKWLIFYLFAKFFILISNFNFLLVSYQSTMFGVPVMACVPWFEENMCMWLTNTHVKVVSYKTKINSCKICDICLQNNEFVDSKLERCLQTTRLLLLSFCTMQHPIVHLIIELIINSCQHKQINYVYFIIRHIYDYICMRFLLS